MKVLCISWIGTFDVFKQIAKLPKVEVEEMNFIEDVFAQISGKFLAQLEDSCLHFIKRPEETGERSLNSDTQPAGHRACR